MNKDELRAHVQAFYSDTSRSRAETRDALEDIQEEIELLVESLYDDEPDESLDD
ncbi:hypothetical protein LXA47_03855 [Massilia sp. P8910]|uniref:hypothetical protein n=1 Tax=Massilia antarctica TaxID=2765360 RepID=UPI001E4B43E6|nr:hypothetical protein [Massilia antarctica]MCE3602732.1 hypothetical protein [Massilia antarctica]